MNSLSTASLHGALTGLLYGLAEYAAVTLEPMWRWGPRSLGPEHWSWEIGFLALYVVSGAIIGAIVGALSKAPLRRSPSRAVLVTGMAILVAGRIVAMRAKPVDLVADVVLSLMAVLILVGIFSLAQARWLSWMSSPWVTIPLVFAVIKVTARAGGAVKTAAALLALWALAAAAVWVASRIPQLQRTLDGRFIPLTTTATLILLPVLATLTLWLGADPPIPAEKATGREAGRPNVVLIVLDTVRGDHLSVYGHKPQTTPNLEAFAAGSVVFHNAVSAADMTLSSYGSMYTGFYPSWHGSLPIHTNRITRLDSSFVTLAETLSQNGYATLAVLANSGYLNREFGMERGFQYYDVRPPVQQGGIDYYLRDALRPVLGLVVFTGEYDRVFRRADQITDGGLRILAAMKQRKTPFFLSLNYMDAHEPYLPPRDYRNRFAGGQGFDNPRLKQIRAELSAHRRTPQTEAALKTFGIQYDASLAFMDAEVARLLDGLKQAGLYDQSLIIVTSDHGEALGERDDLNHPASVHQELVRVPLIIKYPGTPASAGRQLDRTASGVDLMPTILDVAGVPAPANLPGHSLRGEDSDPERIVISESFTDPLQTRMAGRPTRAQRALYQGPWKFIAATTGKKELYRWATDPTESQDVYSSEPGIAGELDQRLQNWLQLVPRKKTSTQPMDRQTMDRLRGLGYVK